MVAVAEDWAGVMHAPAESGARIACLVPSITETLFALGLGGNVVARTGFCVRPRGEVRRVAKLGGTKDPDLDALRSLAPTHLVVNVDENRREDVDAARTFVPHVVVTHPATPRDNPRLYRLLGAIFGCEAAAQRLERDFASAQDEMRASVAGLPRERVLYLIWRRPWMTIAPETYIAATLHEAGWDAPRIGTARYPALADDDRAWQQADRILLSTEPFAFRARDAEALSVATGKPVHLIDGEWTSWYGVRAIEGLRALGNYRRACAHGD
jgi:ABC-type Fe3+-hydroxamate transport system substrate-binding protein